ncbi:MAG: ribonuclease T2 [Phaeospirillum sp.]|nr:ribonuclease T2 [Phaeospirillum sp.]
MRWTGLVSFALAAGVMLAATQAGAEQCGPAKGRVGEFDHYLFSLSWSPGFCATSAGKSNRQQCEARIAHGFVVHGLWPQYARGGWPQCCQTVPALDDSAVTENTSRVMIGRNLLRHEWVKHGACVTNRPRDYFGLIETAVSSYGLAPGLTPSSPARIKVSALKAHWPKLPPAAITVRCKGPRLSEVRLCLDKALAPMDCPPAIVADDNCPGTVLLTGQ